jgi:hypothetical protein
LDYFIDEEFEQEETEITEGRSGIATDGHGWTRMSAD